MSEKRMDTGAKEILALHFPELSEEELRSLAAATLLRDYARGEWILTEDRPAMHAYWLVSGHVELLKETLCGKSNVLHVMGPGYFIDLCIALGNGKIFYSALALETCRVIQIGTQALLAVLGSNAPFALRLMYGLAARQRMLINKLTVSQGGISAQRRVAGWLLHKARVEGTLDLEVGITREVLAGLLGLSRESLCRQLGQLAREGVIRLERRHIAILDMQALRRMLED